MPVLDPGIHVIACLRSRTGPAVHADTTTAFRLGIGFAAVLVAGTLAGAAMAAPAVTTANVNLRDGPGTGYAVIATLPVNTAVAVEGCAEGWCKVDYAGASGWMAEDYLQGLTNPPVIVLPVPVVVPRPHYGHFRPPHRPPVVVP